VTAPETAPASLAPLAVIYIVMAPIVGFLPPTLSALNYVANPLINAGIEPLMVFGAGLAIVAAVPYAFVHKVRGAEAARKSAVATIGVGVLAAFLGLLGVAGAILSSGPLINRMM